ncbi:uncharacterized conserved protein [Longilinea arvoryzae]|uniref:Uncharacterized conserved protein n=1 Tax=Longilinea arvoryzae TaxID=360412 RepID=A0A0S7BFI3_9CHLR|nr:GyrI-like domain-containing protein [Longilinea arvoryzae]GAP12555.1 uncharacterized conserved protein [Longilinea arvoryzae]
MEKLDLKKSLKPYYQPSAKTPEIIQVPRFQFAMLDGDIEPGVLPGNSPAFQEAVAALYGIAYTLKFMVKLRKDDPIDYPVMALEGLWWVEDGKFDLRVADNWKWTVMILQPEVVTAEIFAEGLAQLRKKRGDQPAFARLRLDGFEEGLCVQMMHIGPYATEPANVDRMHAFAVQQGYHAQLGSGGKHHEIYMSDPRKAAPEKMKTVLRHPIER